MGKFKQTVYELIRKTTSELPRDIVAVIEKSFLSEEKGKPPHLALNSILKNIELAKSNSSPICQDTGAISVYATLSPNIKRAVFENIVCDAIINATEEGLLRQNLIDPITQKSVPTNIGKGSPIFDIDFHDKDYSEISIILKGGGCENVSTQYSLPIERLDAHRDLDGVRRCALDAIFQAQGKGCSPGILGICIGGDRASGYVHAKKQFLRKLGEPNKDTELNELENKITSEANKLGIGPMGFGGKTTILGCFVGSLNRIPASYFVTVSYMCWAFRRQGVRIDSNGNILEWLY